MSQNPTDYYSLTTTSSSWNKRLSSIPPPPTEFSASSAGATAFVQHDSSSSHTSPIVSDVCVSSLNGLRNASTTSKVKEKNSSNGNHFRDKYSLTLNLNPGTTQPTKNPPAVAKTQFSSFDMNRNDEEGEDLHSPFELDVPLCDAPAMKKHANEFLIDRMLKDDVVDDDDDDNDHQNNLPYSSAYRSSNSLNPSSTLATPSSEHRDIDALSDAGTYIIEDDGDIAQDDEAELDPEQTSPMVTTDPTPSFDQKSQSSSASSFRRYVTTKRNRHGTFEIHAVASTSTNQSVTRPIVDTHAPGHDFSPPSSSSSSSSRKSSCSSSLLSIPTESDTSLRKEPEGASHQFSDHNTSTNLNSTSRQRPTLLTQQPRPNTPPQNPIKPAECFVISPTFEAKPFPNTMTGPATRRRADPPWKTKSNPPIDVNKESNMELPSRKSPSPPPASSRSIPNDSSKYSFRLQQHMQTQDLKSQALITRPSIPPTNNAERLSSVSKSSLRPHVAIQDQNYASSPFQRNAPIRQTMPANTQYHRPMSASTTAATTTSATNTNKYFDDQEEALASHPSLTKVYMNKSFALRRQRSNVPTTTVKPVQQQSQPAAQQQQQPVSKNLISRQILKSVSAAPPSSSISSSMTSSTGQTNRAVELRRARAQAKIEELAQRTRQQLQKTEQHNDIMSASWHSNASSSSKKDFLHGRSNARAMNSNVSVSQKQDLSKTRTISASSHHRSSSASPNPLADPPMASNSASARYRRAMVSSVTDEKQYQKMNGNVCSEEERCGSLRDDGQRLAIKLIQLSSGILAKLKPNNNLPNSDTNVRELEQLVDKLQTVNRTLSTIDASLTTPTSDESLI